MSLDLAQVKKRRMVMLTANGLAAVAAVGFVVAWIVFDQGWALFPFVGALLAGFAAQMWFILGLKSQADTVISESGISPARDARTGKGA